jgi:hypothetical protein
VDTQSFTVGSSLARSIVEQRSEYLPNVRRLSLDYPVGCSMKVKSADNLKSLSYLTIRAENHGKGGIGAVSFQLRFVKKQRRP